MNKNLDEAPYDEHLILYFEDGTIHSGIRKKGHGVQWPGTKWEKHNHYSYFDPIGIAATYSSEAYFELEVVGWKKPNETIEDGGVNEH